MNSIQLQTLTIIIYADYCYHNVSIMNKSFLPLIKDNDEPGLAPVLGEIRVSKEEEWLRSSVLWEAVEREDEESSPTTLTLRLNI